MHLCQIYQHFHITDSRSYVFVYKLDVVTVLLIVTLCHTE